ncbi:MULTISPECIES: LysR family transcriptional regulator [Gammaproteobacteria]|uniref:LysR family transcriptional regulator n=1 Tax=Gammaproteobacteria TaxID=1236 RepID=UPI000DD0D61E|nr:MULTISPECIES: LysR family transcriptional regulator [Gammaproteobacteria]RTE86025.1 LysR family transcriptional regulator [Aliidiomarina sp. B3213]TCZ91379.1 LysR family transcriptional regulator [Lysobacter sp. N42]
MNRLNYKHLHYFWKVASTGNLTEAAHQLHVSQSALSMQIKNLEEATGHQLFKREKKSLVLTEAGKQVLEYAEVIFSTGESLETLLKSGFKETQKHIQIGVLTNLSRNFIEHFIRPLLSQDNLKISLHTIAAEQLLPKLRNHEIDLALTNMVPSDFSTDSQWQCQLVSRQQLAIIGPPDLRETYSTFPDHYENVNWVVPNKSTELRKTFDAYCSTFEYTPTIKAEADDMAMLRLLARDSGCLSMLPPVVVQDEIQNGLLKVYQLLPHTFEHFYAVTMRQRMQNDTVRQILKANLSRH